MDKTISSVDSQEVKLFKNHKLRFYFLPQICRDFEPSFQVAIFADIISSYHFS